MSTDAFVFPKDISLFFILVDIVHDLPICQDVFASIVVDRDPEFGMLLAVDMAVLMVVESLDNPAGPGIPAILVLIKKESLPVHKNH